MCPKEEGGNEWTRRRKKVKKELGLLPAMALVIGMVIGSGIFMKPGKVLQPAIDASAILFGEFGGRLISVGIIISIFGALNGYILTSARVPYAMAVCKQLPGSLFMR